MNFAGGTVDGDMAIGLRYGRDLLKMSATGRREANPTNKYGKTSVSPDMNGELEVGQDTFFQPMQHAVPDRGSAGSTPARQH